MRLPKKLKIGGYTYEVIYEDRVKKSGTDHPATYTSKHQKIFIDKTQCREEMESSLIHEIIEALNYAYELGLDHKQVSTLEATLYQVLKDNKFLR